MVERVLRIDELKPPGGAITSWRCSRFVARREVLCLEPETRGPDSARADGRPDRSGDSTATATPGTSIRPPIATSPAAMKSRLPARRAADWCPFRGSGRTPWRRCRQCSRRSRRRRGDQPSPELAMSRGMRRPRSASPLRARCSAARKGDRCDEGFQRGPGSHADDRLEDVLVDHRDHQDQAGADDEDAEQGSERRGVPVGQDAADPVPGREPPSRTTPISAPHTKIELPK